VSQVPDSPRLARWLLARALPSDVRDDVMGDLEEVFRERCSIAGPAWARVWYWRETVSFSQRFLLERLRQCFKRDQARLSIESEQMGEGGDMTVLMDIRDSVRSFARRPLLTAAILASLAFGIGANTAVFSILNTLMLQPLPVRDPGSLYQVLHAGDGGVFESSTYALYEHLRANSKTIAGALLSDASVMKVQVDGQSDAILGQFVSGDYFNLLGVRPVLGAVIQPADEPGSAPNRVAVLGHRYWLTRFGGDPGVLGRTMTIDQVPHTIIGITPPEFFGLQVGRYVDVSVPMDGSDDRIYWQSKSLVVRLAPDVPRSAAMVELNGLFHQYVGPDKTISARARAHSFKWLDLSPSSSGLPEFRDRYGTPLRAGFAIVSVLLLLACANLASLFLARAAERRRDLAVYRALGASRARLARQLFTEALLVSTVGGALGLIVSWWAVRVLVGFLPDFGMPLNLQVRPDVSVLVFALGASLLAGVSIGLAPVWLAGKVDFREVLAAGSRTVATAGGAFKMLIVAQVALSTLLVVAAMLLTASLDNLKSQSLGFVADGVLMLTLDAEDTGLAGERLSGIQRQLLERLGSLPGVSHATLTTIPPISSNEDGKAFSIPGVTLPTPDDGVVQVNTVGPGFFDTFGVRVLSGRGIAATDTGSAQQVAVVSASIARHYFPGVDPIGKRIDVGRGRTGGQIEIVGVAEDARYKDLRRPADRIVYVSAFQREAEETVVFALRTAGEPGQWTQAAQREFRAVVASIPPTDVTTLVRQRDRILFNERVLALVSTCFGVLAVVLAGLGVYGVVALSVTQRTAEIGLRIALGATRAGLLWLVFREVLGLIAGAAVFGVTVAFLTSTLLSSLLFGVQPAEPWIYSATVVLLVAIGMMATLGPTIRAMHIDPAQTLRTQ
jgi:predicted permease